MEEIMNRLRFLIETLPEWTLENYEEATELANQMWEKIQERDNNQRG
jgi:hypothetical protein